MRNAFAEELTKVASENQKVFMLAGDIGNNLFNDYKEKHPLRFKNCGIAEGNMISMAAGLAMSGFKPIAYTITPFITSRCFEQIRVDMCYHNLPVIIVGVGSGLCYGNLGPTHHSCEDIAILKSLPNMKIYCPGDAQEVRAALREALKHDGPVYIRLGKKREPVFHKEIPDLVKPLVIKEGEDICILSTGNILPEAIKAAEILEQKNISTQVVSFHTVKPLDTEFLSKIFSNFDKIVTVEEHSLIGGFGSYVAEWANDNGKKNFIRIATKDDFLPTAGSHNYAREYFEIDSESIVNKIIEGRKMQETQLINQNSTTEAAILVQTGQPLEVTTITLPVLNTGQVLVEIVYSGVCHTQISECRGRRGEDKYLPHCLGHEGSGIVKAVGENVTKLQPGDKVIISWMQGSGHNVPGTKYSWQNKEVNAGGVTTFQKKAVISENRLTKIKEGLSMQDAAVLGCAVATGLGSVFNTAKPKVGQSLAVFGTGGIGLCALAGAKISGCHPIIAVDINDSKLILAKQMGATHFINPTRTNPFEEIKRITTNLDFAIESVGIPKLMNQALQAIRPQGGTVVVIGNAPYGQKWELDPQQLNQGKRILGTWGGDNRPDEDFVKYMDLVISGKLDLGIFTSKLYSLSEINQAITDLENGLVARPLIDMNK
jgi:transketolase C-terminal domain/subunit/Zn-dependent alcohol dehydrogenase